MEPDTDDLDTHGHAPGLHIPVSIDIDNPESAPIPVRIIEDINKTIPPERSADFGSYQSFQLQGTEPAFRLLAGDDFRKEAIIKVSFPNGDAPVLVHNFANQANQVWTNGNIGNATRTITAVVIQDTSGAANTYSLSSTSGGPVIASGAIAANGTTGVINIPPVDAGSLFLTTTGTATPVIYYTTPQNGYGTSVTANGQTAFNCGVTIGTMAQVQAGQGMRVYNNESVTVKNRRELWCAPLFASPVDVTVLDNRYAAIPPPIV